MSKRLSIQKTLWVLMSVTMIQLVFASSVIGAVKYSDWRQSTPTIFERWGSEWTQVSSGGYYNTGTSYKCYAANGWTYAQLGSSRENGHWKYPSFTERWYGEWQAYITSSGTHTRAKYVSGPHYTILNQYTVHGWTSLITNGYMSSGGWLNDYHDGYGWWSGQKTAYDATRVYY